MFYIFPCFCGLDGLLDVLCLAGCLHFLCPCVDWGFVSAACALAAGAVLAPGALLFWGALPVNPLVVLPGLLAGSTVFAVAVHDALPRAAARGCCQRTAARVERYRSGCPKAAVYWSHAAVGLASISALIATTARGWAGGFVNTMGLPAQSSSVYGGYAGFVGFVFISLCAGFALLAAAALTGTVDTCCPGPPGGGARRQQLDEEAAPRQGGSGGGATPLPGPPGPYLAPVPQPPPPAAVVCGGGGVVPYATPIVLVAAAPSGGGSPFYDPASARFYAQPVSPGTAVFGSGADYQQQPQYVVPAPQPGGHAGWGGGPQFGANPFK